MSEFNNNAIAVLNRLTAKKIEEKMRPLRMSPTEFSVFYSSGIRCQ